MPKTQAEKAKTFLELHQPGSPFVMPNPWDMGSAKVLEGMGFPALATTSAAFAFTQGRRDYGLTREQAIAHAGLIAGAVDVPVSGDLENGFGDAPEACAETVRQAADAGLVGCSIEDYTTNDDDPIYPIDQAVERVAAAVETARAQPFHFVITARAENFLNGRPDMADTIARLQAYSTAGADVLYAPGIWSPDEMATLTAAVDKPVNALAHPSVSVDQWAAAGVARISLGSWLGRTTQISLVDAAQAIRDDGSFAKLADPKRFGEVDQHLA
ncbi:MAG: isocitrate lyase/phosphoenolpyruvate mutase family protein [Alphaproteobacteria bacterium]|nr:isocitrate lyase/phosphoenolpyruvate mutase family protein [Alphaproteobacteria bacterium SS10]